MIVSCAQKANILVNSMSLGTSGALKTPAGWVYGEFGALYEKMVCDLKALIYNDIQNRQVIKPNPKPGAANNKSFLSSGVILYVP